MGSSVPPFPSAGEILGDGGALYMRSRTLLAHEDKTYPGALIASLSIPWGEAKGEGSRRLHLVWPRYVNRGGLARIGGRQHRAQG